MSAMTKSLCFLAAVSFLAGCGKEVARVPFSSVGSSSAATTLAAGEVAFWTDLDVAYDGTATLDYDIALVQGGLPVAKAACAALGPKSISVGWFDFQRGSGHLQRGKGKMLCSATLPKAGPTTVEAALAFGTRPTRAAITRADLVLRQ